MCMYFLNKTTDGFRNNQNFMNNNLVVNNQKTNTMDLKNLIMEYYVNGYIQTEIRPEGPSEGDIEVIIEQLIEDEMVTGDFDSLLEQSLSIFNIK